MFKKLLAIIFTFLIFSCGNNELTYNLVSEPTTLDPHLFTEHIATQVMNSVYEGLLRLDENNVAKPALAKEFIINGNEYIFTLRDDIKYSDGTKITTDDFVNSFRRALNKDTAARFAELLFPIKNAKEYNKGLVSENELGVKNVNGKLHITLEKNVPYFDFILTLPIAFPYKEGVYSGPYKIISYNNTEIKLLKNEYYWDRKNVEIEKIKYIIINDFLVVENLIKNEEIDIARVEPYDLKTKKNNGELINYQNGRIWYLEFNLENPILKDKENRQIIRNAIDREKYIKAIKEDGSVVAKSVIANIIQNFRDKYPDNNYFTDNKYSDKLKDKKIRLLASNTSIEVKEASFIQEELRQKLGLDVEVTIVSFKDRLALTRARDFDIVLNTYSPKFEDTISILDRWNKPKIVGYDLWRKSEYENLISKLNNEKDLNTRLEIANAAEKILIEDAPIAPLYYSTENWFVRKNLKNIIIHPITNTMDLHRLKSSSL